MRKLLLLAMLLFVACGDKRDARDHAHAEDEGWAVTSWGETYEIFAGERRVRAAAIAGLHEVPVIIRQVPDDAALAMALIENIQREDLNPLEEAHGVQRLIREFDFTHEQAAQAIGRSRSATSNLLRLTNLATPVQQMVLDGKLDMGHARALLALSGAQQIQLGNRIAAGQLSVRATEALVARGSTVKARKALKKTPARARASACSRTSAPNVSASSN